MKNAHTLNQKQFTINKTNHLHTFKWIYVYVILLYSYIMYIISIFCVYFGHQINNNFVALNIEVERNGDNYLRANNLPVTVKTIAFIVDIIVIRMTHIMSKNLLCFAFIIIIIMMAILVYTDKASAWPNSCFFHNFPPSRPPKRRRWDELETIFKFNTLIRFPASPSLPLSTTIVGSKSEFALINNNNVISDDVRVSYTLGMLR